MATRASAGKLDPMAALRRRTISDTKARTHKMAVDEERALRDRMRRNGTEDRFPKYKFVDFIGKGTYGRVYQALDLNAKPPREVAIKLMNLDDVDYLANTMEKDEALNEVRQEINVLMQLKDHGVRNVNLIHDVIEVDGLLWLICEYCPGGSLRTLLRASNNRCEEKYIRVIARELAIALESIHEANVIHRDLKAANVMIHEQGGLQVIDFGVAGVVDSKYDKRGTIIGTPNWMPPEQHRGLATQAELQYGFEVDIWSYIVTIFEIATGAPPHAKMPPSRLGALLRARPPRLPPDEYPQPLCEFVEFVAQIRPEDRPSVQAILEHPYLRDTQKSHPTAILKDLVDKFLDWSFGGGQRHSLFVPTGAQSASEFERGGNDADVDFIFSTSRDLMGEIDPKYDPFEDSSSGLSVNPSFKLHPAHASTLSASLDDFASDPPDDFAGNEIGHGSRESFDMDDPGMEKRVERGGQALGAIFNAKKEPYEYSVRSGDMPLDKPILSRAKSDLPLRNVSEQSDLARKEVNFDEAASLAPGVEIADADTIKQKRKQPSKEKRETMGWQPDWGDIEANMNMDADISSAPSLPNTARPTLSHAETAPDRVAQARASTATINLDDMMGDDDWLSGSAMGRSPGFATPAEDDENAAKYQMADLSSASFRSYASSQADTSASEDELLSPDLYVTSKSSRGRRSTQHPSVHGVVAAPHTDALRDESDPEAVSSEIQRLLSGFMGELAALSDEFPTEEAIENEYDEGASEDGDIEDGDVQSGIEA